MRFVILLSFFTFFLGLKVFGVDGCLNVGTGTLYTLNSGGTYMSSPTYSWNGNQNDPSLIFNARNSKCIISYTPSKTCYIRYGCNSGGNNCTYYGGELVTYGSLPCPIDDYIPFALVAIGGFGFFYIRRRNLLAI